MPETDRNETQTALLALGPRAERPSLARSAPDAAFVSQLIAARDRMAPQRTRRIGSHEGAIGAYDSGSRVSQRRMPAGFRKTILA